MYKEPMYEADWIDFEWPMCYIGFIKLRGGLKMELTNEDLLAISQLMDLKFKSNLAPIENRLTRIEDRMTRTELMLENDIKKIS